MLKTPTVPVATSHSFVKGQRWKYGDHCIRIEHVGKMLVEHRCVSLENNRNVSFKRMGSIKELQKFLKSNDAVLMEN